MEILLGNGVTALWALLIFKQNILTKTWNLPWVPEVFFSCTADGNTLTPETTQEKPLAPRVLETQLIQTSTRWARLCKYSNKLLFYWMIFQLSQKIKTQVIKKNIEKPVSRSKLTPILCSQHKANLISFGLTSDRKRKVEQDCFWHSIEKCLN